MQKQKPSKNGTIQTQNFRPIFDLAFRWHKKWMQKYPTYRRIIAIIQTAFKCQKKGERK